MDVKEFVAETLSQVTEAIKENESSLTLNGQYVSELKNINMFSLDDSWVTYLDFDIAVTESTSKEGGAKLKIAGVGDIGGDLTSGTEIASRVKFRVPLQINK
jgi:hypothetical protein